MEGQTQEGGQLESKASFLLLSSRPLGEPGCPLVVPEPRFPWGEGDVEAESSPSWRRSDLTTSSRGAGCVQTSPGGSSPQTKGRW